MSRPSSISWLTVFGFGLAIIPLVLVIVSITLTIARFAEEGQSSILRAVALSDSANRMNDAVRSMERYGLQYSVLQDSALLVLFQQSYEQYRQVSARFTRAGPSPADQQHLAHLNQYLQQARRNLPLAALEDSRSRLEENFSAANREMQRLQEDVNDGISAQVRELGDRALQIKRQTLVEVLLALPLTIGVAVLFIVLITRPIKRLDRAITALGDGDLDSPIAVSGPKDIAALGDRLEWLRQHLNELEATKIHFLRQLSHELKTPLTAIREGSELLQEDLGAGLAAEQVEIVHIVRDNSLRLQRLIEDLLRFSVAEGPVSAGMLQTIPLHEVLEELVISYKPVLRSKGLRLENQLQELWVKGHRERIRTIFDNLLSNAVKFSPQNGTIRTILSRDGDFAIIDVIDAGPGVAPEEREKIFDILYRGSAADSGKIEGSGLGLAITKEYVISYGGTLEILTTEGPGAHFQVRLPLVGAQSDHSDQPDWMR
ncbi:MAG: HAMP domain-containing protein [Acidithiobacillus sp.]|nr:HAMP domain-containing protein [Acidithiobacillus sp.]